MGDKSRHHSGHSPRKRFGQHFLTDATIIHAIVRLIAPQPSQFMVEIGPGLGALTQPLLERLGHLTVIELDRDLAARLRLRSDLTVIEADVLKVDFAQLREVPSAQGHAPDEPSNGAARIAPLRIVGNLPYNISTPILFHLFASADAIADQHFMLQKEVVERMVAAPATAAYGRLSVMLQWRYQMESMLSVPPGSFEPAPRVDSSVVRMLPKRDLADLDSARLAEIVKVAFSQRRKLLRHTLGEWLQSHSFEGRFDLQRRAEEVSVAEYVALAGAA
ncbi:MAG: 16S rRNA (adenine(1518)-N(6)/adenine(1519)-N(6))-dimethyltransferase RsmA [Burkholderiaceae bacterium]